jgi:protein HOOK3
MKPLQSNDELPMDNTSHNAYSDDGTYRSQSELSRISKEREELEIQNKQLIDKHSALLNKYVRERA